MTATPAKNTIEPEMRDTEKNILSDSHQDLSRQDLSRHDLSRHDDSRRVNNDPREKQPRQNQQLRRDKLDIHGWIVLDKPIGMTSTQAVAVVKRLFSAKRAGHAGTLDPL